MFAVVRTGGKQYRVAPGDTITVEKIKGDAGDSVSLGDVLLAGDGGELKAVAGVLVSAEILEQGKGDKVVVFKKKRRHNYRRKNGHRQRLTVLRILGIGDEKAAPRKTAAAKAKTPQPAETDKAQAAEPAKGVEPPAADAPIEAKAPVKKAATAKPPAAKAPKPAGDDDEKKPAVRKPAAKPAASGAAKAPAKKPAAKKTEDKDA